MKKILVILAFLILTIGLIAETVATVGQSSITSEQLYSEIKNYNESDSLSFLEIKKIALDKLIDNQLLLNYAAQNSIKVDNLELESYFIQQLGDMPRFRTNGEFDYYKFGKFKNTETGQDILAQMKHELLINKTKALVMKKFELPDEKLLEEFIMDNTEISLNYAILDINDIAVPNYVDVVGADRFYHQHQNRYRFEEKAKFSFYYFPFETYSKEAEIKAAALVEATMLADTTYTLAQMDSLSSSYVKSETKNITLNRTMETYRYLKSGKKLATEKFETPYMLADEHFGIFTNEIVRFGFALEEGELSEPVLMESGYIILILEDLIREEVEDISRVAPLVWDDYLVNFREKSLKGGLEEYFSKHFDEFVGKAAYVNLITVPSHRFGIIPQKDEELIKQALENTDGRINELEEISEKYNLKNSKEIIYLEKYSNDNSLNELVKQNILRLEYTGFIRYDDDLVYYSADTFFPEFIPAMNKIKEELVKKSIVSTIDTTGFFNFYKERSTDFNSPDSLKLGGAFVTINPDSVNLTEEQIIEYYNKNLDDFNREKSVEYSCFYVNNLESLSLVTNYLLLGKSWQELQRVYNDLGNGVELDFPREKIVAYDKLPQKIRTVLLKTEELEATHFMEYKEGWISLMKKRDYPSGSIDFYEAQYEIAALLKQELAEELAQLKARAIFDSTSLFGNVYKYASKDEVFTTDLQPADEPFPKIGELGNNKAELMRKWRNEKLNTIVKADSGYAVIFQLKRVSSKQQSFEEALPNIANIFSADEILESAKTYAENLQNQIKAGANADSLLFYLGGWYRADDLTLESRVFGKDLSRLILEDITHRDVGYYSNIIRIRENHLMFYYINHLRKIPRSEFYKNKTAYRKKNIERKFNNWLSVQKENSEIVVH